MNNAMSFDRLIKLIKTNLNILMIWCIGLLSVTAIFTFYILEPEYQSVSRIVVNDTPSGDTTFTTNEIDTNISLIQTYEGIIVEPIILDRVIDETDMNISAGELREKISFQRQPESLIFGIVVDDSEPERAALIANTTAEIFQREVVEILPVNSVTILSEAIPDYSPVSPNIFQNLLFGVMAGVFIGFMHILLKDLLDKRVKDERIIVELDWLNLGSVKEMTAKEMKESSMNFSTNPQNKDSMIIPRTLKDRGV